MLAGLAAGAIGAGLTAFGAGIAAPAIRRPEAWGVIVPPVRCSGFCSIPPPNSTIALLLRAVAGGGRRRIAYGLTSPGRMTRCRVPQAGAAGGMKAFAAGLTFFARRLMQAALVMLAILIIAFAVRSALGDPLREIVGEAVPEAEREKLLHELGLDAPWPVQLARYLGGAVQGDLGTSSIYKRPTLEIVLAKFPASFELVLGASLIVLLFSVPAGIYCAVRPRALGAKLVLGLSVLGISIPVFLTGIFLITIFSVWLGWLPAFGRGETVRLGVWETGLLTRRRARAPHSARADALLDHAAAVHQAGARRHARRARPRLCAHRPRQGRVAAERLAPSCAAQRAAPARRRRRPADRHA